MTDATCPPVAIVTAAGSGMGAADNVRMDNLLPGFIDSLPEDEAFRRRIPMGRFGTVEEIAATTAFLLSGSAGYIPDQNLLIDGGVTRSVWERTRRFRVRPAAAPSALATAQKLSLVTLSGSRMSPSPIP